MVHQYLAVGTDPKASRWRVRPFIITTACEELMDICQLFSLRAAEDLSIKTFSAGTAAQHVLGKGINSSLGLNTIQDPEDKEVAERRLDCRKKLINMKSGNAESEAESGGRTVIQQEDLQEWLDNLQLKLRQACNVPTNPAGPRPTRPSRPGGPAGGASSQSRSLSLPLSSSPGLSSRPVRKYKLTSGPASSPSIIRPRSINGLADQAAAALTDGQYIERLQVSLQQASVSSLHDRLAERKLLSSQLPAAISAAVRPKTTVKSPTKVRHPSPVKAHRTVKHPSDKASKSSSLPATSPIQPPVKSCKNKGKGNKKGGRHRTDDGSSDSQISNSTSSLSLGNLISRKQRSSDKAESSSSTSTEVEKPVRGRSSFVASDIFDCGQTVDDIYQAAEHLLLPPARRDVNQTDQSTVQYESQLVHRQASAEEEIPEVEDFWGAVPEY